MRSRLSSRRNWLSSTPSSGALRPNKPKRPDRPGRIEGHEVATWEQSVRVGGFDPLPPCTEFSFVASASKVAVLYCRQLVTLRIEPSLVALPGPHATNSSGPNDKIYPVVKRSTILATAVSSQPDLNRRGEENDQQDHRSDL